ncbi:MAG: hypothetical protein LUE27_05750 [Clostridia bacterium]|nr:hypothetical protein [Clostridia bacterium]
MRVLSKAFSMMDTFTQDRFFGILSGWLKGDSSTRELGEALEGENRAELKADAESGSGIETFCVDYDGKKYTAFRCTKGGRAVWTIAAILEQSGGAAKVYLQTNSSAGAGALDVQECRQELAKLFAGSRYAEKGPVPYAAGKPFMDPEQEESWLLPAISGHDTEGTAVVILSTFFKRPGYDADENLLASVLDGVACVVCEDGDYSRKMLERGYHFPYNGAAAIYVNGERYRSYQRRNSDNGDSLTGQLMQDTLQAVSSCADGPSWDSLMTEHTKARWSDRDELLEEAFSANTSLEQEVRELKEKVSALSAENTKLLSRSLRRKGSGDETDGDCIIRKGDVPEFYDEEQYDMIISILQSALSGCAAESRQKELLERILARNPIRGNGKEIFDTVKRIFTDGSNLTVKDAADLRRVGIRIVSDNKHYKLVFKDNSKYMFILPKTSGDRCSSGKNMASEIISKLSVYRKA